MDWQKKVTVNCPYNWQNTFEKIKKKPSREDVEIEFQNNYKNYNTDNLIKPLNLEEDYFNYGRDGVIEFGEQFYQIVSEARKEFP